MHHGGRQVSGAAASAEVGVPSIVLGVQRGGEWGGEVQVAEVGKGAACIQQALVVGQTGVLLRRREYTAEKVHSSFTQQEQH